MQVCCGDKITIKKKEIGFVPDVIKIKGEAFNKAFGVLVNNGNHSSETKIIQGTKNVCSEWFGFKEKTKLLWVDSSSNNDNKINLAEFNASIEDKQGLYMVTKNGPAHKFLKKNIKILPGLKNIENFGSGSFPVEIGVIDVCRNAIKEKAQQKTIQSGVEDLSLSDAVKVSKYQRQEKSIKQQDDHTFEIITLNNNTKSNDDSLGSLTVQFLKQK